MKRVIEKWKRNPDRKGWWISNFGNEEKEIWKWVVIYVKGKKVSYKDKYKVSNFGRIKSVARKVRQRTRLGKIYLKSVKEKILSQPNRGVYPCVELSEGIKGVNLVVRTHIIILETFVGPCPEGMECRHLNDVKNDNRLENLCWGTRSDNAKDAFRNGTAVPKRGESNPNAKFTEIEVLGIRKKYLNQPKKKCGTQMRGKITTYSLAKEHGVSQSAIFGILNKKWGDL